jgi:nucleoside-diphosphate-sugar epimerase
MITVLGAGGFIGSYIVNLLRHEGKAVFAPGRNENLNGKNLGHVIYCIGLTADFRTKPFETVEAHVCKLATVLQNCIFESFIYLSSTRLYIKSKNEKSHLTEEDNVVVNAHDPSDIFAASKMAGELLALNCGKKNMKIARLSNVFGADLQSQNFITSIVNDAVTKNQVVLQTTPSSAKDYIAVEDVCGALLELCQLGGSGVYNLCYGENVSNEAILNELEKLTGASIIYAPGAQEIIFQEISNAKLCKAINFKPGKNIIASLPEIIAAHKI